MEQVKIIGPVPFTFAPSGTQDVNIVGNDVGLSTELTTQALLTELEKKADLTETQPVSITDPVTVNTISGFALDTNLTDVGTKIGATNSAVAASPTTTTGLSGILRGFWAGLVALLPSALTSLGNFKVAVQEGTVNTIVQPNLIDAAGRMKTSIPTPQISIKYRFDKLPLLVDEKGTGTATFDNTNSCVLMSVTAGQYLVRQTFKKGNYVSGMGLVADFTMSGFQVQSNVTKRIGYFSATTVAPYDSVYDGISLYNDGTTIKLQVHRSGTLVHDIAQVDWADPLDGTGPSNVNADWSKIQVCQFDFIWLSGGTIRFWMQFDGTFYLINSFNNTNDQIYPYMTSPNQPIRYEIRSTTGVGSINQICASIYDDGGGTDYLKTCTGQTFTVKTQIAPVLTAATSGTMYAMIGVRLASGRMDANVLIAALSIYSFASIPGRISLIRNPTVAGTFTFNALTNTPVEWVQGSSTNTVTGGFEVESWTVDKALATTITDRLATLLGSGIDGVPETYVFCVSPNTNNLTWYANMNLIELI